MTVPRVEVVLCDFSSVHRVGSSVEEFERIPGREIVSFIVSFGGLSDLSLTDPLRDSSESAGNNPNRRGQRKRPWSKVVSDTSSGCLALFCVNKKHLQWHTCRYRFVMVSSMFLYYETLSSIWF
jgi:hypothetical protein